MIANDRIFSSSASKAAVSIVLVLLATGLSVSSVLYMPKPIATKSMSASSTRQLTFGSWNDAQPVYSTYGLIAFSSNKTGSYQLFTMDQSGNHQTQLTSVKGDASYPKFSPDGNIISYLWSHRDYTDLCFVSVSSHYGKPSSFCATNYAHVGIHYSWSENSDIIAYDNGSEINLYYLGENRTTPFSFKGTAYDPEFCGANMLCFTGSTDHPNETAIWLSNLDGSNLTRLSWTGSDYLPQYSPVTNMILYLANYTGNPEAWIVGRSEAIGSVLFEIVPSINAYYPPPDLPRISVNSPPKWNPTNDQVLVTGTMEDNLSHFVIANATLVPVHVSAVTYLVTPFSVAKPIATYIVEPNWSPDGQKVIYVSESISGFQKIFVLNLELAPQYSVYGG